MSNSAMNYVIEKCLQYILLICTSYGASQVNTAMQKTPKLAFSKFVGLNSQWLSAAWEPPTWEKRKWHKDKVQYKGRENATVWENIEQRNYKKQFVQSWNIQFHLNV